MAPEPATAEFAYQHVKAEILRGRFAPAAALNVHLIATDIGISISPVRDALERLVGERILDVRPGGGFQLPQISEQSAQDLYQWHGYLALGLAAGAGRAEGAMETLWHETGRIDPANGEAIAAVTGEFFYRLGEGAGNVEHLFAIRSAGERLHALRLSEDLLRGRRDELQGLIGFALRSPPATLRSAIRRYHKRRLGHVSEIVARFYQSRS